MMKYFFTLTLILISYHTFSQSNYPKILLDIGYNYQMTKMEEFNNHLDLIETDVFKLDNHLNNVNNLRIAMKFQPIGFMAFGVYFGKQFNKLERFPIQKKLNPDLTVTNIEGYHKNEIDSKDMGIVLNLYFDYFLTKRRDFFKKSNFSLELQFGIGYSKYYSESHYVTFEPISIGSARRQACGFQSGIGLGYEYSIIEKPFICSIGIRIGYQLYTSSTLEDDMGVKWGDPDYSWTSANKEINLDFSGFYYGIYLKIGK